MLTSAPSPSRRSRSQRGWSAVFIALLLMPLLAFAGMAVDLGAWYARATQIQRAADAAALAGVPLLSISDSQAIAEANRVAALNGFTNGVDGVTVAAARVAGAQRLRVTITDSSVDQFLTRPFRSGLSISRTSTAEQVRPVPLGSPRNYLGTQNLLPAPTQREGFWAAMSGYCASREQGDRIGPISDANFTTPNNPPPTSGNSFGGCQPGSPSYVVANQEYTASGYLYAVNVPDGFAGRLRVQIFDAPACMTGLGPDSTTGAADRGTFNVTLRMRGRNDLDPLASPIFQTWNLTGQGSETGTCTRPSGATIGAGTGGVECGSGARWHQCWQTIWDTNNPTPGTYYIQIAADPDTGAGATQDGSNSFALRAWAGSGAFATCSADPTSASPTFNALCPNVHGLTHLGVFANIGGTAAEFFLADVGPEHNGKTMDIVLWDTGEGASSIEILDPLRNPVSFRWDVLCQDGSESPCSGETAPSGGYGGVSASILDVSNGGVASLPQPGPHRLSGSKYNDRLLRLRVTLPNDIVGTYGNATWWRIRYRTQSSPTDRTTWSVSIQGDPVRLVPNA